MFVDNNSGISIDIYGESHAEYIGVIIKGLNVKEQIDLAKITQILERRKSARLYETARKEKDEFTIISGIDKFGNLDGKPIDVRIYNTDIKKEDYNNILQVPRPSTSDYPAMIKDIYKTGGGAFSGRMTAPLCIAGSIFIQLLNKMGINIEAHVNSIGKIKLKNNQSRFDKKAKRLIAKIAKKGDTLGGTITCKALNMPIGVGGALFNGLEGEISKCLYAIPSVKGVEFGSGFYGATTRGSKNNDQIVTDGKSIYTSTNNDGGIVGGMSNGMPLELCVAFKPIPSIKKEQNSVNLKTLTQEKIKVMGRHDCCVIYRCLPIVESAVAIAIYSAIKSSSEKTGLEKAREEIDVLDNNICLALEKRAEKIEEVSAIKKAQKVSVKDSEREKQVIDRLSNGYPKAKLYIENVYGEIFNCSVKKEESDK